MTLDSGLGVSADADVEGLLVTEVLAPLVTIGIGLTAGESFGLRGVAEVGAADVEGAGYSGGGCIIGIATGLVLFLEVSGGSPYFPNIVETAIWSMSFCSLFTLNY